ncbi:gliding motility-associated C-terminal domain-containing protein [Hymenobacter sp. BT523]|uniref:DUF7948 domain-containing protein n=1 Tax=Hymenobacter sp. BT523 TaxID=2795725 RepID=UPI0018EB68B0|nr:gliding motility-associated C-terminal domain-containing protein [Hymenobacter sp. BT523]MBJ6111145.1 gliding motility-associated C-terminal domain-containing protein [Hymenobacter sp. BT523]
MTTFTKQVVLLLPLLGAVGAVRAEAPTAALPFVANKGQWETRVKYAVDIPGGRLYLENNAFTYHLYPGLSHADAPLAERKPVASHAFRVTMVGAAAAPAMVGESKQTAYRNYFLGNDPAHWASAVPLFGDVRYRAVYPGVDLRWHQQGTGQLEYDFELAPGARPAAIRLRYDGLDGLSITPEGHLQLRTSVGEVREQAPVAWQFSATGQRRAVPCRFVLSGREVTFALGKEYNPAQRLVIDPVLVFSTYSGSPGGESANTTVADSQGNMYTGGYVLGSGYPVTLGAIKSTFAYGNIGISKLSAAGNSLIYATYLGGGGTSSFATVDDYPLDFDINAAGELLVLGSTISTDYPTTNGAYDRTLNNGNGGRDLVVTRINSTGTGILASTFLGGTSDEAASTSLIPGSITTDPASGDVLVASTSFSIDYPRVNAFQNTSGGGADGVLTRLSPTLTSLRWSTYLGGSNAERAHDVKVAANGDVYVCGATQSTNFPVGAGGLLATAPSNGASFNSNDGFVLRYSSTGSRLNGTFLGTTSNDVARFLDFDASGNVLVGGASEGTYLRTGSAYGAYVSGTTGIFVHGLNPALSSTLFATQISVVGFQALSSCNVLTGFGRDNCGRLYFSAYAGALANPGCPRTPDAYSQQARSLYLCVLGENATSLLYGTYIGELNSSQGPSFATHLHYAASNYLTRAGVMYHITCNTGKAFGTTPGAFSAGLTSSNDGAAFKFDLAPSATSALQLVVQPPAAGCAPYALQFVNITNGSNTYSWDFGDGSPLDTAKAPSHTYATPGTYTARLVATRRNTATSCGPATASLSLQVTVVAPAPIRAVIDTLGCSKQLVLDPARLSPPVVGGAFTWNNGAQTPTLTVTSAGKYTVQVQQAGQACPTTIEYTIGNAVPRPVRTVVDSLDCGQLLVLDPARLTPFVSGRAYSWSTGAKSPSISVTSPGRYRVEIDQGLLCPAVVEFNVKLSKTFQIPNILTANGDNLNANFKVPASYGTPELKVFNRWGRLVYETKAYRNEWTGSDLPAGVYHYLIRQPGCNIESKGWVEIVR